MIIVIKIPCFILLLCDTDTPARCFFIKMKNNGNDTGTLKKAGAAATGKAANANDMRVISIWIDDYDDIFSDFDPRPLSDRNISDDFLYEVKKISRENNSNIHELKLLIPEKNRKREIEDVIIKRLHTHFKKNYQDFRGLQKTQNKKGIAFAVSGAMMMIAASYLSYIRSDNFLVHTLFVILEPAGWFLAWAGLDNLIYSSKEQRRELDFYTKMTKSKIEFLSI